MKTLLRIAILTATAAVSACSLVAGTPELPAGHGEQMKAIVYTEYGTAEVLRLAEIDRPVPQDHQVLVKVRAAAANPLDWHYMRGTPYIGRIEMGLRAPQSPRLGVDMAGEVLAVGKAVTKFKPGDAVFGVAGGAFAEYVRAAEHRIALKPASLSFEDAAAVPVAAITALQGLRDKGQIKPGQKVLINGASGGVGTFAVQLAKHFGAEVTAVCSGRNAGLVRSLGADHVIDYTQEDFTLRPERYDLILDNVGTRPMSEVRRALAATGTFVSVGGGGPDHSLWGAAFVGRTLQRKLLQPFTDQRLVGFMAEVRTGDLELLGELLVASKVRSVIDRRYPLSEVPEAIRYLESGRARGKVVIALE